MDALDHAAGEPVQPDNGDGDGDGNGNGNGNGGRGRIRLSVLDQTPVIHGHTTADAIAATIELAQAADDLGYTRYWCAEHHGLAGVANPCPEVMLARLGATTKRIRIGSGGIMLPYYSPFKVAEQFLMLEALYPGRIDLGLGRAPGGTQLTARLVGAGRFDSDQFPQLVSDLIAWLDGNIPEDSNVSKVLLQPAVTTRPQVWMLGSSDFGASLAAHLGIRFTFASFISAGYGDAVMKMYRDNFKPGQVDKPYSAVALFVICADTQAEADDLEAAVDLRRVQMAYGMNAQIPSVEQARGQQYSARDQAVIVRERPRSIIGTPERVVEKMMAMKTECAADEIIVLTVAGSYRARLRSYQLLAEAFELNKTETGHGRPGGTGTQRA